MISIRQVFTDVGVNSARDLRQRIGSHETSLTRLAKIASIGTYYIESGGARGPFGLSMSDVRFSGSMALRSFAGGKIVFPGGATPQGQEFQHVEVRYLGFRCLGESNEGSAHDEPYFIVGAVGTNGSKTVRFGPYEGIDQGSEVFTDEVVVERTEFLVPPMALGVVAMENDEGSPEEAEAKVRKVFEDTEKEVDKIAAGLAGYGGENHVMPDWLRTIVIGWIPEGIAAVFGMGDDLIESRSDPLFSWNAAVDKWNQLPMQGKHGAADYNWSMRLRKDGEGDHQLFFRITVFDLSDVKHKI